MNMAWCGSSASVILESSQSSLPVAGLTGRDEGTLRPNFGFLSSIVQSSSSSRINHWGWNCCNESLLSHLRLDLTSGRRIERSKDDARWLILFHFWPPPAKQCNAKGIKLHIWEIKMFVPKLTSTRNRRGCAAHGSRTRRHYVHRPLKNKTIFPPPLPPMRFGEERRLFFPSTKLWVQFSFPSSISLLSSFPCFFPLFFVVFILPFWRNRIPKLLMVFCVLLALFHTSSTHAVGTERALCDSSCCCCCWMNLVLPLLLPLLMLQ